MTWTARVNGNVVGVFNGKEAWAQGRDLIAGCYHERSPVYELLCNSGPDEEIEIQLGEMSVSLRVGSPRYQVDDDGGTFSIFDNDMGVEIAVVSDYETEFGHTTDARSRANAIANALNAADYDYQPEFQPT